MASLIDPTIRSQRWRQYRARLVNFGTWSERHHFRIARAREVLDQLERVVASLDSLEWTREDTARLVEVRRRVSRLAEDAQQAALAEALGRPLGADGVDDAANNDATTAGAA